MSDSQFYSPCIKSLIYVLGAWNTSTTLNWPGIDERDFKECDWKSFYEDVQEAITPDAPEPRGKEVILRMFVDSSHADHKKTCRSRMGYLIYLNMAPVPWLSKKQATIEPSVFGAEFVAVKIGMKHLWSLWYKLRMMVILIDGPSYVYGDNMSVIHNTQRPESTLKKSNSICRSPEWYFSLGKIYTCEWIKGTESRLYIYLALGSHELSAWD